MASGEMSPAEFAAFLRGAMKLLVAFSAKGSIHFYCMDWRHIDDILGAGKGVYSELKNLCVWAKFNAGMGAFYRSQHEFIFAFKAGTALHINNFGLGAKGRHRSNVWNYLGVNTFRRSRMADLESHPAVKPIALVADAILDCSDRSDLVLDPFCGSGTTLLTAARTGRRGAAIEIDPAYCDLALRCLEKATGLVATHADGGTFAEVAAARSQEVMPICRPGSGDRARTRSKSYVSMIHHQLLCAARQRLDDSPATAERQGWVNKRRSTSGFEASW